MEPKSPKSAVPPQWGRRRSARIPLVIPVEVVWLTSEDQQVKERVETEVVSAHGALLRMKTRLPLSTLVSLTHLKTGQLTWAKVVFVSNRGEDGLERIAVETLAPSHEFWGVSIPTAPEAPKAAATEPVPREKPLPSLQSSETKRIEERPQKGQVGLRVPIRIRAPDGSVEVGKTENLSRTGAQFISEKEYAVGMTVFVAAPYTAGEEPIETKAMVEGIQAFPDSSKKLYAIKFDLPQRKQ